MKSLILLSCHWMAVSDAFSVTPPPMLPTIASYRYDRESSRLFARTDQDQQADQSEAPFPMRKEQEHIEEEQVPLSELDARILKEMLQDDKLDLQQEANMKKLLERGVAPKSAPSLETPDPDDNEVSPFSSTVFKTLANTKLWKGIKRDAGNILESLSIYVANRVERDAKLLGAVGLFAWERALKDVSRALPASGTSGAAVGRAMRRASMQLGNSSSYEEMQAQQQAPEQPKSLQELNDLYEEFNSPLDEIKSVSQSIRDILKGDSVSSVSTGQRRLRSVAPAGQGQSAERQRRAYQRRKISKLNQEQEVVPNIGRAAGAIIDTAAEMKRELQVESSKPGYRSEGARKAIAAGAAETKRILETAKQDGWRRALFGTVKVGEENIRKLVGSEDIESVKEEVDIQAVVQLLEVQSRVVDRLNLVIEDPAHTWLIPDVVKDLDGRMDEDALRDVVSAMIRARDDLELAVEMDDATITVPEVVEKLRHVKSTVDTLSSLAANCVGMKAGELLGSILHGQDEADANNKPSLLRLDEVEPSIAAAVQVAESLAKKKVDIRVVDAEVFIDVSDKKDGGTGISQRRSASRGQAIFVTDYHKNLVEAQSSGGGDSFDPSVRIASVEVISDDDFDSAFGAKQVAVSDDEEGSKKEDEGLIGTLLLRGLDVVFFLVEKLVTSVIPSALIVGSTVAKRLELVGREGMGSKGWKTLDNVQTGSKRY